MDNSQIVELTQDNFQEAILAASQPTLVDFWALWCAPCRAMAPVVDALAEVFAGRLTVGKVNVDRYPELAARYSIMSIPTLVLFRDGQLTKTWVGVQPQQDLVRELVKLLSQQATRS